MRETLDLNGVWECEPVAWLLVAKDGSLQTVERELPAVRHMQIPCNWHMGGLPNFYGSVRFKKEFPYSSNGLEPYLLFEGVDYACEVWLNGRRVGEHEGCFQTFEFRVGPFLKEGKNMLEVLVLSPNELPGEVWPHRKHLIKGILSHWDARPGGWDLTDGQDGNTGGIWGDVRLEFRRHMFLVSVRAHTQLLPNKPVEDIFFTHWEDRSEVDLQQKAYVWFKLRLNSCPDPGIPLRVLIELYAEDGAVTSGEWEWTVPGSEHHVLLVLDRPRLWWTWDLGHPHLYRVEVRLHAGGQLLDEVYFHTGVREIGVEPETGTWRVNGKRLFVRGTNVIPTLWLGHYRPESVKQDLELIKGAHMNGVRVCVHVTRKEWYEACDREGILIWQDFPLQWGYAENKQIVESAVRQIRDMIRQLHHHPSIGLWCCQNESLAFNNEIVGPQLYRAAREEDGSRYVHQVSHFEEHPYNGWYYGVKEDYAHLSGARMLSEFGAQALPSLEETTAMNRSDAWPPDYKKLGYHNFQYDQTFFVAKIETGGCWESFVRNSQDYQAQVLKLAIESIRKSKFEKAGSFFQFMFMDAWPSISWSVVSHARIPKKAYFTLQQVNQPILAGVTLSRTQWPSRMQKGGGDPYMSLTPWVINDLHTGYPACTLEIAIESADGRIRETIETQACDLPPDSKRTLSPFRFRHMDRFPAGDYEMVLVLACGGQILSRNSYAIGYGESDVQS
ncbi:glycoside hydrolase family 2 protein [Gorillibacterium sp. sgz5001074]|uniref:glycoside hydrolase family 2 protein n=1 Tax=Gorillibacterium sp. sgz5001074 TaxID=3446695 RepID=UPI003F66AC51